MTKRAAALLAALLAESDVFLHNLAPGAPAALGLDGDLRSDVANARDQARRVRIETKRSQAKPDWAEVELQVLKPLVEVRDQIREELARRSGENPLVPLDRDPVPGRYSELVRRYYEQLGRDRQAP